jgi:anthranilate synthase component I
MKPRSMVHPDFKEFSRLARTATLVPVAKSISADLLTPVSAFLAVAADEPDAFLLESVEGGERIGRYTFLGVRPFLRLESRGDEITIRRDSKSYKPRTRAQSAHIPKIETRTASVFEVIKELLHQHRPAQVEGLPPFTAGAVGYCAYDIVRQLENIGDHAEDDLNVPDCILMFFDRVLAFDHLHHQIHIVASADVSGHASGRTPKATLRAAYERSVRDIAQIERRLAAGWKPTARFNVETRLAASPAAKTKLKVRPRTSKARFLKSVEQAKEYIAAGDIFQVVLSQRWDFEPGVAPFDLYRALRTVNPSPYMYFLRFGECGAGEKRGAGAPDREKSASARTAAEEYSARRNSARKKGSANNEAKGSSAPIHVLGSSPEMLVRAAGPKLEYRPIAGTHPRGKDEAEDAVLEKKMLADEKERAEHVMLVDLGRNDLGRVSEYGSVKVRDLMYVERYSHVMHIVSALEGRLRPNLDAMDAFAACFPAGTLSGAPKVRAMQIIEELEPARRAIYGGSVLYADFAGNLDSCIAIRTLLMKGKQAYLQAGAGIVADSNPDREFEETENKARAILRAVQMARGN